MRAQTTPWPSSVVTDGPVDLRQKMPRLLLLGSALKSLATAFREANHVVARIGSGEDFGASPGPRMARLFDGLPPDLLVADLREADDCSSIRRLREILSELYGSDLKTPCLALLPPDRLQIEDLHEYVDEILLPPYLPEEAVARASVMLRRSMRMRAADQIALADIVLDLSTHMVHDAQGTALPLTPREAELLRFLCIHRGKFFDRERLLNLVWGIGFDGGARAVDIHVCRLRSKLPPLAASRLQTLRGVGYGFGADA